ncbi:hypothetical protein ACU4GD_24700 [Cupriavidus basilensis]
MQPAGRGRLQLRVEEENTGNGALATAAALRSAVGAGKRGFLRHRGDSRAAGREPDEAAQMGVFWMFVELTGTARARPTRPAA